MEERYYSVEEISNKFNINAATVRHWLRTKSLCGKKFGRQWRVPESEIDRFMEEANGSK